MSGTVELTIFERVNGRTYPCRVRNPREWAAALTAAEDAPPENLAGILEWPCHRCGGTCEANLATLSPVTFDRPALHWCEPSGLRRWQAMWAGTGTDARSVVPALPTLPLPGAQQPAVYVRTGTPW